MEEKKTDGLGNIYSAIGGALLGMAIVDQVTKTVMPVMEKLKSGEPLEHLKLMSGEHENPEEKEKHDNEIAELKRKLEEYESKAKGQHE